MPVWHEKTRELVRQGKLVLLAVIQEQHPQRCRLFAQWQKFDWPILHDPINLLGLGGVPVILAVDEHGVVRSTRPKIDTFEADFVNKSFPPPESAPQAAGKPVAPDLAILRKRAQQAPSPKSWRELADALVLWGGADRINDAVDAYTKAAKLDPNHGDTQFRLGVAYRMRFESPDRRTNDFQAAVDRWTAARATNPNQYIWRRRIEQYGPRLTKPYSFYDWVNTAKAEIAARGQRPIALSVEPSGAEFAYPAKNFAEDDSTAQPPDPQGRILRDAQGLIRTEVAVVPPRIKPGAAARVHLTMRPNVKLKAHWNNEAQPLLLWVDTPQGWQVAKRLITAEQGKQPETDEPRHLEFEVRSPADYRGTAKLQAYALYYVCEDVGGSCRFVRQDIPIDVPVGD